MTVPEKQAELQRLKAFFSSNEIPMETIKIEGFITLYDPLTYVEANFIRAEKGIDNSWNDGAIIRLQQLERYIVNKKNARMIR